MPEIINTSKIDYWLYKDNCRNLFKINNILKFESFKKLNEKILKCIKEIYHQIGYHESYTMDNLVNRTGRIAEGRINTAILTAFKNEGLEMRFKYSMTFPLEFTL